MSAALCTWAEQCCPGCAERAAHADAMWPLFDAPTDAIKALRQMDVPVTDQLDLFALDTAQQIEFWQGVHAAIGREYRRRASVFAKGCPQDGGLRA